MNHALMPYLKGSSYIGARISEGVNSGSLRYKKIFLNRLIDDKVSSVFRSSNESFIIHQIVIIYGLLNG